PAEDVFHPEVFIQQFIQGGHVFRMDIRIFEPRDIIRLAQTIEITHDLSTAAAATAHTQVDLYCDAPTDHPLRDAGEFTAVDAEVITAGTVAVYDFISLNRSIRNRCAYHPEHQFIAVINLLCC